jgi:hypothetical protein
MAASVVELHTRSGLDRSDGKYGAGNCTSVRTNPKYPKSFPSFNNTINRYLTACAMNVMKFSNSEPRGLTSTDHAYFDDMKNKFEEVKDRSVMNCLFILFPLPVAVLDIAKLRVNCQRMIDATQRLGLLWRPHVKTHKVTSQVQLAALAKLANFRSHRRSNSPAFKSETTMRLQ